MAKDSSAAYGTKSKKEKNQLKANKWCWGYILYTVWALVIVSCVWDAILISNDGEIVSAGEFGFRECIRETRRAKTKATYTRARGPLLIGNVEDKVTHYDPLGSEGVTYMEDVFGGLISGPANWWKYGEFHVTEHDHTIPPDLVVHQIKESLKHWDNGNPDPCHDRQLYIQGQHIPYMEQVTSKNDVIKVVVGFVDIHCDSNVQEGFLSILQSAYHGGPMVGRIYQIVTKLSKENILENYADAELEIEMTEIGSFIEDRGYGSHMHYTILAIFPLVPIFLWYFFVLRLANVKVVTNVLMLGGKVSGASGASSRSKVASVNEGTVGTDADTETSSDNGLSAAKKESNRSGIISPHVLETWKLPFFHFFLMLTFIIMNMFQNNTGLGVIKEFFGAFHTIHLDFPSYAVLLASQEMASWVMVVYGKFIDAEQTVFCNKAMIYAYQYAETPLLILKVLNIATCVALWVVALQIIHLPIEVERWIFYTISFVIFIADLNVINYGLANHPFRNIDACMIGGLASNVLQTSRGISNFLVSRQVKGASKSKVQVNGCPGLDFNGMLSDAIMIARPDYVMEGFINGQNIQIQLIEKTGTEMSMDFTRFKPVGDHQFEVTRHWLFQGKTGIILY